MALSKKLFPKTAAAFTNTDNFAPVTYTGNGSTQSITSLDFQPDFVWIKNRTVAQGHSLWDTVRGASSGYLQSQLTNAEAAAQNMLTFDAEGFNVSTNGGSYTQTNRSSSSDKYVAWCFKGGGTAVSNTDGSITSTVSANQDAGFSIVKYTSTGTNGSTIGHGLSTAPDLVIIKSITHSTNWIVYNSISGTGKYMYLNSTSGDQSASWFGTSATTFTLNNTYSDANTSGRDYIAYCFHSVDGYQKVGSYTGGSSGSGSVITTGFKPRFLLVKCTSAAGEDWIMLDSTRGGGDTFQNHLRANTSEVESTFNRQVTFVSNGFYWGQTDAAVNGSSRTYIYLAIA